MKKINHVLLFFVLASFFGVTGCSVDQGTDTDDTTKNISLTEELPASPSDGYCVIENSDSVNKNRKYKVTLSNTDSYSNCYFLFTNPTDSSKSIPAFSSWTLSANTSSASVAGSPHLSVAGNSTTRPRAIKGLNGRDVSMVYNRLKNDQKNYSQKSNSLTMSKSSVSALHDYDSVTSLIGDVTSYTNYDSIAVTKRAERTFTSGGVTKKLYIYVANNCWTTGGTKTYKVTQDMVDAMADKFLDGSDENDIYHWVTGIYGEEWDDNTSIDNELIDDDDTISILLYDIDGDNVPSDSFTAGFFWAKDNFTTNACSYSNQMLMFYIDAVMYAYPDDTTWDVSDYYPSTMISTLAHEFQHMIHFNQKEIKRNESSDTWLNEMCSLVTEDFVANKLGVAGPRGMDSSDLSANQTGDFYSDIGYYNAFNDVGVTAWDDERTVLANYATAASFGTFLARNYGGTALFGAMVADQSSGGLDALLDATGTDILTLLRNWGIAGFLSDYTSEPADCVFNNGDSGFTESDTGYSYGSINLFNYYYKTSNYPPKVYYPDNSANYYSTSMELDTGEMPAYSNRYYHALWESSTTGKSTWTFTVPKGVYLTIIAKQ